MILPNHSGEIILVDKPLFWSSFAVVGYYKQLVKPLKIGHAGTLDPMASGLLVLCSGKKTKEISSIQQLSKKYTGRFILGYESESYDLETSAILHPKEIDDTNLQHVVDKNFVGEIEQRPPNHSAVKVDGIRSYDIIRSGAEPELKSRKVHIYSFQIEPTELPNIYNFEVACSKGTYIRSLIHNLGQTIGCGALLIELRRTQIGDYLVEDAQKINTEEIHRGNKIREKVYQAQGLLFLQHINFNH